MRELIFVQHPDTVRRKRHLNLQAGKAGRRHKKVENCIDCDRQGDRFTGNAELHKHNGKYGKRPARNRRCRHGKKRNC